MRNRSPIKIKRGPRHSLWHNVMYTLTITKQVNMFKIVSAFSKEWRQHFFCFLGKDIKVSFLREVLFETEFKNFVRSGIIATVSSFWAKLFNKIASLADFFSKSEYLFSNNFVPINDNCHLSQKETLQFLRHSELQKWDDSLYYPTYHL